MVGSGVEGGQASEAIIRPIGLNAWPPSANTKGVVRAELESGPIWRMVAINGGWSLLAFMSEDVHLAKTFGFDNDIFLNPQKLIKRQSSVKLFLNEFTRFHHYSQRCGKCLQITINCSSQLSSPYLLYDFKIWTVIGTRQAYCWCNYSLFSQPLTWGSGLRVKNE